MKVYSGIDLHSNNSVVLVSDEADRVLYQRRLPNELSGVLQALEPYRQELQGVVVEATYNWYWLVDGLRAAGYRVHLANPGANKQYSGLKHRDDDSDAAWLGRLLRLGVLRTGYICPREQRRVRDLARRRMQLVRSRTAHVLAVENVTARETGARLQANEVKRLGAEQVKALGFDTDVSCGLEANAAVIGTLNREIRRVEKRLHERVGARPEFALLSTVPGIGRTLATVIMLETGAIERFAGVGHFASYARCVDSVHLSNNRKKGEGNVRNGNKYLAWAFIEAANMARRYCLEARRFHDRKRARTNSIVATKALAHKLARACYHILKSAEPFDAERCFYGKGQQPRALAGMAECDKAPHPATPERNCRVRRVKGSLRRAAPALDPRPRRQS
jgi:transposase